MANLAAMDAAQAETIARHLGRYVEFRDNVFAALNTAFIHDGALIVVPAQTSVAAPVHLLFIAAEKDAASYPRSLVVAGRGSAATIVEDFVSLHDGANLTNANFTCARLDDATLAGAIVTGATWNDTTCPDGTNSNDHGNTCVGHL